MLVDEEKRIQKLTQAVLTLPVLPTITAKILEMVDHPKASAESLSNLVSKDQVLTAKILKLANSPFYGGNQDIHTVKSAVVVIGYDSLREISLSLSVFNLFKEEKSNSHFEMTEFWKHSIAVGLATRVIAQTVQFKDTGLAFTAGLLHDLGKLVLNHYLPQEFLQVQELVHLDGMTLKEAELKIWGVEHAQVGVWLSERWKLPVKIIQAMKYHHTPWDSISETKLCWILYLADTLVAKIGLGSKGTNNPGHLSQRDLDNVELLLKLDLNKITNLEEEILTEYQIKASDLISEV